MPEPIEVRPEANERCFLLVWRLTLSKSSKSFQNISGRSSKSEREKCQCRIAGDGPIEDGVRRDRRDKKQEIFYPLVSRIQRRASRKRVRHGGNTRTTFPIPRAPRVLCVWRCLPESRVGSSARSPGPSLNCQHSRNPFRRLPRFFQVCFDPLNFAVRRSLTRYRKGLAVPLPSMPGGNRMP